MKIKKMKNTLLALFLLAVIFIFFWLPVASAQEDYWWVRCKKHGYGIDFNINAKKAFIILQVDSGGTIPAASTTNIIRYVNNPGDKYAIFDFGSATKIGVNVSNKDRAFIYRVLQGKTYRVCDATVSMK